MDSTPYSRPYVAEHSHSDPSCDPGDRLCLADTRCADAAAQKRGTRSGIRQRRDGKHLWRSDRFRTHQNHSLPRMHFLWSDIAADRANGKA